MRTQVGEHALSLGAFFQPNYIQPSDYILIISVRIYYCFLNIIYLAAILTLLVSVVGATKEVNVMARVQV